jgi:putative inorganic carbon (hco3(-)) transporter
VQLQGRVAAALHRSAEVYALELVGTVAILSVAFAFGLAALEIPTTILVLALAAAVVALLLVRIDLAILAVVATAPLEAAFASGPGGISVTKLAGGICFASFAVTVLRTRRLLIFERGQAIVLAILALALTSSLQAREISPALTTTSRYASFAIVYIILTQFGGDRVLLRRIAWVLAIGAAVSAGLGLNEYFKGRSAMASLPYSNQNDFAFILATSLPLMFWLLGSRRALRPVVLGMIGVVFAATLLSLSRGTLVGLGAGMLFFLLTDRRRLRLTLLAGAVATIATIFVVHSNPERFQQALLFKQKVAHENVTTRFEAWGAAARLATDHPLLGIGPGNFQFYYNKLTGTPVGTLTLTVAHNAFLDIGAELGLVAMCLLALYLLVAFARLTEAVVRGYGEPGYAQALRISLIIAGVSALFLSEQYFLPFWLVGGLATGIWLEGRRKAQGDEAAPHSTVSP